MRLVGKYFIVVVVQLNYYTLQHTFILYLYFIINKFSIVGKSAVSHHLFYALVLLLISPLVFYFWRHCSHCLKVVFLQCGFQFWKKVKVAWNYVLWIMLRIQLCLLLNSQVLFCRQKFHYGFEYENSTVLIENQSIVVPQTGFFLPHFFPTWQEPQK